MAFLVLLCLQSAFHFIPQTPLAGAEYVPPAESLSWQAWSSGEWQENAEQRSRKNFGFRPALVRCVNQLRYSLFDEHNDYITYGSDGTLFETAYRASICGEDYIGDAEIERTLDSLDKFRNDLLAQGKKLVLLIAPNKWRTLSNKVEVNCKNKPTNYESFIQPLRNRGYAICDAIDQFRYDQEQGPTYPLHSRQGTHWSVFGAALSADYLRFAFAEEGLNLPKVRIDSLEVTDQPRYTDKDLHDLLNIMFGPDDETLAYPRMAFPGGDKPNVVVIGDSYYWTYYYLGIHQGLFDPESKFFYYNRTLVQDEPKQRIPLTDELRRSAIAEADAVLLVMGEPSLAHLGFGILGLEN
ncbi:MAG: hypothetical protein RLP15_05445 [Cryomorphaceae bacterium]